MTSESDDRGAGARVPSGFLETPAFVLAAQGLARETTTLAAGADVGPYRITSLMARGGMGVVYRATDTRLHRDVALKMIAPVGGAPDEASIDRFLREARMTAAIDHDNVVKVYDVGVFEGQPFMVSELVDGETVRSRLEHGALPVAEAVRVALGVARGLAAAHAAGLVHRDLKPENVVLTRAGTPKILDFGVAKLVSTTSRLERRATASTLTGVLLGTVGYLAPEQIRGDEVDGRADLFALGSMLFEALTGQRAFAGENTVDTLHAILREPPPDLLAAQADVPDALLAIVRRLLEKEPVNRFQSAIDLVWALDQYAAVSPDAVRGRRRARSTGRRAGRSGWILAGVGVALVLGALTFRPWQQGATPPMPLTRFTWTLPPGGEMYSAPAVSPDNTRVVWVAIEGAGRPRLFVRELSSLAAAPISGTEGARQPFWSPDGTAIGFFANGKLKRVSLRGGPPVELAEAPDAKGGAWSSTGVIVFQPEYRDAPMMRVSQDGGAAEPATALDPNREVVSHRWPSFLPDGRHFLYFGVSANDARRGVYLARLDESLPPPDRPLFTSDSGAFYTPLAGQSAGALLSVGNGQVEFRPFDPARRVVTGDARAIAVAAVAATPQQPAMLSASADVLAYGSTPIPWGYRFAHTLRDGTDLQVSAEPELGGFPRLSPDGRRLARCVVDGLRSNPDIWVDDLDRGTKLRLTTSVDHDVMPIWSPDGRQVAYRSGTLRNPAIGLAAADGSGVTRTLPCPDTVCDTNDWSPDGTYLLVTVRGSDLWIVPLDSSGPPRPLLVEKFVERDARISPDGKWIAYVSDESGRAEVSVRSMSGPSRRFVVSKSGGDQPVWRQDGRELFYVGEGGLLHSVDVRTEARQGLAFGAAVKLKVPPFGARHWGTTYDVSQDGRRVYFPHPVGDRAPGEFSVVLGWSGLVR